MRTLAGAATAAIASGAVAVAQLIKVEFSSGTVLRNTSNNPITYNGDDYPGALGLVLSPVNDTRGEMTGMSIELHGVDATLLGLALDESDVVQGATVTIYGAIIDVDSHTVLDVQVDWLGKADTMTITENGETAVVAMTAESKGLELLRGTPLTYTDADQQSLFPGDLAFQYVVDQVDKSVVWPSKEYFYR